MKNLSRLTALLLALVMLLSITASATEGISRSEFEADDYNTMLSNVQTYGLIDSAYQHYVDELVAMDVAQRYETLKSWHDGLFGPLFYERFIHYYTTTYPDGDLICTCAAPVEYGTMGHGADCPWNFENLTISEQYEIAQNMSDEEKANLSAETLDALARVNTTEYTTANEGANVSINVPEGAFAEDYQLEVTPVTVNDALQSAIDAVVGEDASAPVGAFDISFPALSGEGELQPAEGTPVELTFTVPTASLPVTEAEDGTEMIASNLGVFHMVDNGDGTYTAEPVPATVNFDAAAEYQTVTVEADAFSIYAVIGSYSDNWNYNNYRIVMTVGDSLQVATSTSGNSYRWSIASGDTGSFTLSNTTSQTASITANATGTITLQCVITPRRGSATTETMVVEALPSVGSSVDDDIIFYNIDKEYVAGDTEYENTYGPYVMKIRFEDTEGNVLKYADGTTVGDEFYVFDSEASIDKYTFSADAPDGYTYSGAFFYWGGHFEGDKVYVTSVDRNNSTTSGGSHLYYSGNHTTSGEGRWYYQSSGVLHVVYAPIDEVHTVIFKDHCGYDLANYALSHNDRGVTFPTGYVDSIDTMASSTIPTHHSGHSDDQGMTFEGKWVVTGGGNGIDGTYTTNQLKNSITGWNITSNITITAQCSEPTVTITYKAIPTTGVEGKVDLNDGTSNPVVSTSETLKVVSGVIKGALAIPAENYVLEGWYTDEACTIPVDPSWISADGTIIPRRLDNDDNPDTLGKYVEATYYAKFIENTATINYVPVGPGGKNDGSGSVDPTSETVSIVTGVASGSTATANATYKFVGWYNNEACTGTALSTDPTYVPTRPETGWVDGTTYYALFEYNLTTLTITKEGMESIDAGQSFLFEVTSTGGVDMVIAINGNGSETISGLTVGDVVTVTEIEAWSWRYSADPETITLQPSGNSVTIDNDRDEIYWLDGDCYAENVFSGKQ